MSILYGVYVHRNKPVYSLLGEITVSMGNSEKIGYVIQLIQMYGGIQMHGDVWMYGGIQTYGEV